MSRSSRLLFAVLCAALVLTVSAGPGFAQVPKPVTKGETITETAVIEAIDATNRLITLKNDAGLVETIYAGPDVRRFNELKVGDKVTFRYYESVVYAIQPPGAKPPARVTAGMIPGTGPRPGGTFSEQVTAVVTILAIDPAIPSVTVQTEDGNKISVRAEDKKNLEGVKVGDKVQITYTRALAISVEAPKK